MPSCLRKLLNAFLADFQFLASFCPCLKTASQFWPILTSFNAMKCRIFFQQWSIQWQFIIWADILPLEAHKKMQKFKRGQKMTKIGNWPKKHFVMFLGIFECTIVFHTSKKFPNLADYMVKRIFHNIQLWLRNKQSKLTH